ncbi:MAG: sugar phosphate isomerase/epimerase [Ruminococcaceae bacterium]|nr:sugar phosphate isomerase/epimerase [Oscillospiraceae bacterium]
MRLNKFERIVIMRIGRIQNDYSASGFDLVKNSGLEFVEICRNDDNEAERLIADKESVKEQIIRTGIDVSSVGRWNHNILKNGKIDEERFERYAALLDTAIYLNAKTFVCGCNYDDSLSLFKNYCNAIEFFGRLIERADGRINVAIHNCEWGNFVYSPKQWEVVLGELSKLYIKFDPSHAYNRGSDYLSELSDWCERVAHIHIKGTVHAGKRHVDDPPAGMDDINWRAFFAILYSRGYDGDLSIEPHSGAWLGERGNAGVKFTADYMRQFIM